MRYKRKDIVKLKIGGESAMILQTYDISTLGMFADELPAYEVRLPNYDKKIVSEFELVD